MGRRKKIRYIVVLLCMLAGTIMNSSIVRAAKENDNNGIGFTYENVIPENQISDGTYFDLKMKPGQKQTLETRIMNTSDTAITVKISLNNAKTTETGLIDYGNSKLANSPKMKQKLTDYLTVPKKVHLKKGQTKIIQMKLAMPKEEIKGILLAGIELEKIEAAPKAKGNFSVQNQYAYTFSISTRTNDEKIEPDLKSNKSRYVHKKGEGIVKTNFTNTTPVIIRGMEVENKVVADATGKEVLTKKQKDMKMAPCSIISINLPLEDVKEGDYTVTTKVKIGEKDWQWKDKIFVPKTDPVTDQKTTDKPLEKKTGPGKFIAIIVVILVVGTVGIYLILRKARK